MCGPRNGESSAWSERVACRGRGTVELCGPLGEECREVSGNMKGKAFLVGISVSRDLFKFLGPGVEARPRFSPASGVGAFACVGTACSLFPREAGLLSSAC